MRKALGFPFLLLLVTALILLSGVAINLYFQQKPVDDPLVSRIILIGGLALVSGIGARVVLMNYRWLWKVLAAGIGLVISLWVLDRFFPSQYIVNFFDRATQKLIQRDFLQAGSGILLAMLVNSIGARKKQHKVRHPIVTPRTAQKLTVSSVPRVKKTTKKTLVKKRVSKPVIKRKIRNARSVNLLIKQRTRRREKVMLKGETEHRCPYCMEIVKKNDPRGVVICPECKTWHHKDCWDVTGTCQVAHRHDL